MGGTTTKSATAAQRMLNTALYSELWLPCGFDWPLALGKCPGVGDKKVGADISFYDMGFLCVDSYLGFIGF